MSRHKFISDHIESIKKSQEVLYRHHSGDGTLIDFSGLSTRASNILVDIGVLYWEDLDTVNVRNIRNCGKSTLNEINAARAEVRIILENRDFATSIREQV